jgi:hypothetical protein
LVEHLGRSSLIQKIVISSGTVLSVKFFVV